MLSAKWRPFCLGLNVLTTVSFFVQNFILFSYIHYQCNIFTETGLMQLQSILCTTVIYVTSAYEFFYC